MSAKVRTLLGVVIPLALVFNLAGCSQMQPVIMEDSDIVKQREKMQWVDPKSSGSSTDWSLYMDEEGGGP